MKKTTTLTLSLLALAYMTPIFAQPVTGQNMVTRQTIHSGGDGSTTITTVIEPAASLSQQTPNKRPTAMPAAPLTKQSPAIATPNQTAPQAGSEPTVTDDEVVSHYHFGSQKNLKSTPAHMPSATPATRHENGRENPEDVMMRILNQAQ